MVRVDGGVGVLPGPNCDGATASLLPAPAAGGVYTVHVQSSGRRFATGGADALVKVWSLAPVLDAQKEQAGPLVLATLSDHTSTVNTVRFSKNGKYLASGEAA